MGHRPRSDRATVKASLLRFGPNVTLVLRHGWGADLPFDNADAAQDHEALELQYLIDVVVIPAIEVTVELDGIVCRDWIL